MQNKEKKPDFLTKGVAHDMDINSLLGTMLSDESVRSVSARTGASDDEVRSILSSALPAMLQGAQQQSAGSDTAQSFANALTQHGKDDTADLASFLGSVDMDDGAKIVAHLLGANGASTVSEQAGVSSKKTDSVLSTAAPLLLALLGQETKKKKKKKKKADTAAKKDEDDEEEEEETTTSDASDLMSALLENVDTTQLILALLGVESGGKKKKKKKKKSTGSAVVDLLGKLLK